MALDDVILQIGEFGKYQRRIYFIVCFPAIICSFHMIGMSFLGLTVSTRCMLPNESAENTTFKLSTDLMNTNYVLRNRSGLIQACQIRPIEGNNTPYNSIRTSPEVETCKKFIYDTSVFESSTATEWDLVCDRTWIKTVGESLFMVGFMFGSVFFGALSDKFGRKPTVSFALSVQLVAGLLVSLAPNHTLYTIARMIVGASCGGVFLITFVMAMELVGPTKRGVAGVCYEFFWNVGYIGLCIFAYIFPSWRKLQLAISLPSLVFIVYWWLIPESIRWMMTNGRVEEAKDVLQQASKENGKEISRDNLNRLLNDDLKCTESGDPDQTSILDLFRYPVLRRNLILLSISYLVINGAYYGLSWKATSLNGNMYINHLLSGLVEIPANIFLLVTLDRWGRRTIMSASLFVAGISLIASAFIPEEYLVMNITLFMIGKAAMSASFGIIFIFTVEQMPTVVRNVGLGTCCTCGKIGGICAPFVNNLSDTWAPLPLIVFGTVTLFCGLFITLLPETLNRKLPDTIEEGEQCQVIHKINKVIRVDSEKLDEVPAR